VVAPFVLAAVAAGALPLAACGGDEEASAPGDTPTAEDAEGSVEDLNELVAGLAERFYQTTATVRYEVEVEYDLPSETDGDQEGSFSSVPITFYWRAPDWRVDIAQREREGLHAVLLLDTLRRLGPEVEEVEVRTEETHMVVGGECYQCFRLVSPEEFPAEVEEAIRQDESEREVVEELRRGWCRCLQQSLPACRPRVPAEPLLAELVFGPDTYARFLQSLFKDVTDTAISQRAIEGQEATCLSVKFSSPEGDREEWFWIPEELSGPEAKGELQWCFTRDGIPVLLSSRISGPEHEFAWRVEAIDFSRDVSDGDLEPLYPPLYSGE
jgi:hypothetical protein